KSVAIASWPGCKMWFQYLTFATKNKTRPGCRNERLIMNARKHVWIGTIGLLCVLCAGAILAAQAPQQSSDQVATPPAAPPADPSQDPKYRLNVNVELVNVTATVLDDQGKYMDGLKLDDFQVF